MTLRLGPLFLLIACNLLPVATAHAALPDATKSTCPGLIRLVGSSSGVPDVTDGLFTVIVLDGSSGAIQGSRVTVSFCGASDLRLCQNQLNTAYTVDCVAGTVSALTDPQGRVDFTILGGSTGPVHGSSLRGTVRISADDPVSHVGVLLSDPSPTTGLVCSALDEDGVGGLAVNDLSIFTNDVGSAWQRSDFNGDGIVDASDQGFMLNVLASARMITSCAVYCPTCAATPARAETWGSLKLLYR